MPRLIAWVASECLSWWGVTWPILAAVAAWRTAASTRGLREGPPVLGEQERARLAVPVLEPLAEQGLHAGVQRDVPVGVELADWDVQPVAVADPQPAGHRAVGSFRARPLTPAT
jgi:hypothetical protein